MSILERRGANKLGVGAVARALDIISQKGQTGWPCSPFKDKIVTS